MSRKDLKKNKTISLLRRERIFNYYVTKYYNLFMGRYKVDGLDYQHNEFLFRKFWAVGRIAGWKIKNTDELGLADFAVTGLYNYLDYPVEIQLINTRGYNFIPTTVQKVDEDVIIGWAQYNKRPIKDTVEFMAGKIADTEITIRKNLKAQQTPWLIGTSSANETKVKEFYDKLDGDEDALFFEMDEDETPKSLVSGAPYILDKLYNYKNALENELLTFLGINNMGASEKKEHLITSEIDVNNEVIEESKDNVLTMVEDWLKRVNARFGYNFKLVEQNIKKEENTSQNADEGEEDDEEPKDNENV